MTAQHTPGKLMLWGKGDPSQVIAFESGPFMAQTIGGNDVPNARRLVACWNACTGIDTDTLEELGPDTSLAKIAARAIEQRGDLLVALQNLVGLARMGAAPLKDYKAALAVADAAIQKATNKK